MSEPDRQVDVEEILGNGAHLASALLSGNTLRGLLGRSPESQESLYYLAYTLYQQARYQDALRVFGYLLVHDHLERRFYSGFAASLQALGRHAEAVKYHGMASLLDLSDPRAPLHAAECHLALGDRGKAKQGLEYALAQAKGKPAHRPLYERAEALLALMSSASTPTGASGAPTP